MLTVTDKKYDARNTVIPHYAVHTIDLFTSLTFQQYETLNVIIL